MSRFSRGRAARRSSLRDGCRAAGSDPRAPGRRLGRVLLADLSSLALFLRRMRETCIWLCDDGAALLLSLSSSKRMRARPPRGETDASAARSRASRRADVGSSRRACPPARSLAGSPWARSAKSRGARAARLQRLEICSSQRHGRRQPLVGERSSCCVRRARAPRAQRELLIPRGGAPPSGSRNEFSSRDRRDATS